MLFAPIKFRGPTISWPSDKSSLLVTIVTATWTALAPRDDWAYMPQYVPNKSCSARLSAGLNAKCLSTNTQWSYHTLRKIKTRQAFLLHRPYTQQSTISLLPRKQCYTIDEPPTVSLRRRFEYSKRWRSNQTPNMRANMMKNSMQNFRGFWTFVFHSKLDTRVSVPLTFTLHVSLCSPYFLEIFRRRKLNSLVQPKGQL